MGGDAVMPISGVLAGEDAACAMSAIAAIREDLVAVLRPRRFSAANNMATRDHSAERRGVVRALSKSAAVGEVGHQARGALER